MKQMKSLMVALALLMGVTFTSCMNDNESSWDRALYVTVDESGLWGGVTLMTDDGFTLVPTNPEMLKTTAGTYVDRAFIYLKWAEGVEFDGDIKKKYQVTIIAPSLVPTKDMTDRADTIKADLPLALLGEIWGANGRYLNVPFRFQFSNQEVIAFDLYPEKVEDNVLVMRLRQSLGKENSTNQQDAFISFKIPALSRINNLLEQAGQPTVEASNDSVYVKVIAKGNNETLTTKNVKIKVIN